MSFLRILFSLNYQIILVSISLGLLLISLATPWLVVNLFGQRSYSGLDNMRFLANLQEDEKNSSNAPRNDLVLSDLRSVYLNSSFSFILSMVVLYPVSITTMIAAVIFTALRRKYMKKESLPSTIALAAGILAIVGGVTWIYSIESFKTQFSRDAELSGGIIGEEWKGKADVFVDRLIVMGVGHYIVIIAGVIAVFAYFIERASNYQRQSQEHHHSSFSGSAMS